jgi:regulator of RNase E activity RraA
VGGVNKPVGLGQVHVAPRSLVVADANGDLILPRERVREVTKVARAIEEAEARVKESTRGPVLLRPARRSATLPYSVGLESKALGWDLGFS